ncbi:MAG: iron-sulfur cluster assembly accessory protein [Buchnera aphidicola (Schlechtendalia peitan)]
MKKNTYYILSPHKNYINNREKIKISYTAQKQIKKLIYQEKKIGIKLGIKKSGCAGMKYYMNLIEIINDTDVIFTSDNNILLLVSPKYLSILDGIKIDFIKEGVNYTFKFTNKKVSNFCGCGESFNIST